MDYTFFTHSYVSGRLGYFHALTVSLDLIHRVPEELWTDVRDIVQDVGIKTIPMEKKCKKAKWLSEEALHIAVNRSERQRRKRKIYPFECRVPKNSKER